MKLKVGQSILVDGVKAVVLGILVFSSYTEYFIKKGRQKLWLEQGRDWRRWEKRPLSKGEQQEIKDFFKNAPDICSLPGTLWEIQDLNVYEAGSAIVLEAKGETEDTSEGEKVIYIEGNYPLSPFLTCIEIWDGEDGEIEYYQGKIVEVILA